ncbi:hypothetical protein [Deferrisoma camini]|uniref:hypothetical protein n=1 Tax=Deferrisoma camini TaxID=1035120 RepID=UPI00046C8F8A|nr:hypothetical protein [Deferrisoma camini]
MRQTQRSSLARPAGIGLWAGLLVLLALPAWGGYTAALDQALFYLSRGSTYGADAVRSLRKAEAEDPTRAWSDPRWLEAAARAYVQTGRHTEAYWALERLEAQGALGPEAAALREHLLEASGLGRVRMLSAVPLERVRLRMTPLDPAALDPAGRRAVERLSELFDRGLGVGPDGTVLLVPEGRFRVVFDPATPLEAPKDAVDLEVWAGDEVDLRLVPRYPRPASWRVAPGARTVDLAWPPLEGMTYRLVREAPDGPVVVCEGTEPSCRDQGLAVGVDAAYRLEVRAADGALAAVGRVTARTLAPVDRAAAEAQVQDDLRVAVAWVLGDGAVDEVRVVREDAEGDRVVLRRRSPEPLREGQTVDGPFLPEARPRPVSYRIEAWVAGAEAPSAAVRAEVEIPARVERVVQVAESVDRGLVVVYWETLPREAAAQGYRIYRQRGRGTLGELVGETTDAFAREFSYEVADPLEASQWRHFVIPVVGDRWILDPEWIRATGEEPDQRFEKRRRMGQALPDLALSWDPYRGARLYAVVVGEKEVLVKRPYVEVDGLQTPLLATRHLVRVYAVGAGGERVPLLTLDLSYQAYPRPDNRGSRP